MTRPTTTRSYFLCWVGIAAVIVSGLIAGCSTVPPQPTPSVTSETSATPDVVVEVVPRDAGPIDHARGSATVTGDATYSYVVASGDAVLAISHRFGVCIGDVWEANPGLEGNQSELAVGRTLVIERATDIPAGSDECVSA